MKPLLLKHVEGESIGRFPVWMMRQAGRYLPSYRAIREKHTFWEMVRTPELAVTVSLLPLDELEVDAVIFFSDILTLPFGMGIPVEMKEAVGPVIPTPLRTVDAFAAFEKFDPARHVDFVGRILSDIRSKLRPEKALLGFAGAPWTVSCYLSEGKADRHFGRIKQWMHRDPADLSQALSKLADATFRYLRFQHESGAHMVQVFDTWLSEMPRAFFVGYYAGLLNHLFSRLKAAGIPTIYFAKNAHHLLADFSELTMDVLSTDNLLKLGEVEQ